MTRELSLKDKNSTGEDDAKQLKIREADLATDKIYKTFLRALRALRVKSFSLTRFAQDTKPTKILFNPTTLNA
jgi:hypothetical protein